MYSKTFYSNKEVKYLLECYKKNEGRMYKTAKEACKKLDRTYAAIAAKLYFMQKNGELPKLALSKKVIHTPKEEKLKKKFVITVTIEEI